MNIAIKNIRIQKAGPLHQFQQELGKLNLIFGLNESGKTYLVEFLLQSLFRLSKKWSIRDSLLEGTVDVVGLRDDPISFSPGSNRKLEDYWKDAETGLPSNLSRLLVIKGGELALSSAGPGGITRDELKTALTSQAILDEIWGSIQPTIRNADFENGRFLGKNMGKLKEHDRLEKELGSLKRLLNQIEESYSQGPARQLELQMDKVQEGLSQQLEAKQHLAYQIGKKIRELQTQNESANEKNLTEQRDRIRDFKQGKADLSSLWDQHQELRQNSQGYSWLKAALEIWEEKALEKLTKPPEALGIAAFLSLAAGLFLLALEVYIKPGNLSWIGAGLSVFGFSTTLYFVIKTLNWANLAEISRERKEIQRKFEEDFGFRPEGLADLREQKERLQEIHFKAQTTQSLIDEKNNRLELLNQRIQSVFEQLGGEEIDPEAWQITIDLLAKQQEELKAKIIELKLRLSKLDVPENAQREDPAHIDYDQEIYTSLQNQETKLRVDLENYLSGLEAFKIRACERTGDDINTPWPDIYYHLQTHHRELDAEYKRLTAEIVAGIGLTNVLTQLREEEDQKIVQSLNDSSVIDLITKITRNYHQLDLVDNQIFAQGKYARYPLQDLSTGAREQILLAIRLGIASQVSGGVPLFLILDDAFQHSDWQRRVSLVESTVELANHGWQVIYLSMDEHIRDLFLKLAEPVLDKDFQKVDLTNYS
jgi:hypothetical protein